MMQRSIRTHNQSSEDRNVSAAFKLPIRPQITGKSAFQSTSSDGSALFHNNLGEGWKSARGLEAKDSERVLSEEV